MRKMFLMLFVAVACETIGVEGAGSGRLCIAFAEGSADITRAQPEIPDTGDFIITVTDSKGKKIYSGSYGACPETLEVPSGSYVVTALSSSFDKPAFSSPQYGDEQCVVVPNGGVADVSLLCTQQNCAIRLKVAPEFLTTYPDGVLFLKSARGKLMYGYSERRAAYFIPGQVSLLLDEGGISETLMTRTLQAGEMLDLKVNVAKSSSSISGEPSARIRVAVDTSCIWISDTYVVGGSPNKGDDASCALTVSQASESAGTEDVWVAGYIVGGDLTSASASFSAPFKSRTNILLGSKSSSSVKASCLSVQLPAGEFRDALNLVDNPLLIGKKVYIRGDIVDAYYGIPGLKNVSDYKM